MKKNLFSIATALMIALPSVAPAEDEMCYLDAYAQGRLGPAEYGTKAAEVATYFDILRYRAACGFTDDRDVQYFEDLAAGLACSESAQFSQFYAQITADTPTPPFDFSRETIADPEKFDQFCSLVHDIDPAAFATNGALVEPMPETQKGLLDDATIFGSMNAR
jgi:hypothetical protein